MKANLPDFPFVHRQQSASIFIVTDFIATRDPLSNVIRNTTSQLFAPENHDFNAAILDDNSPTQPDSFPPIIASHTLSPTQQSNNNNNFILQQFLYTNTYLIAIAQPNFQQNTLFPLHTPFFWSGVAHRNCITPLLSNDSCVAMKHATCQQQRSKVRSSVPHFHSELQRRKHRQQLQPKVPAAHTQRC